MIVELIRLLMSVLATNSPIEGNYTKVEAELSQPQPAIKRNAPQQKSYLEVGFRLQTIEPFSLEKAYKFCDTYSLNVIGADLGDASQSLYGISSTNFSDLCDVVRAYRSSSDAPKEIFVHGFRIRGQIYKTVLEDPNVIVYSPFSKTTQEYAAQITSDLPLKEQMGLEEKLMEMQIGDSMNIKDALKIFRDARKKVIEGYHEKAIEGYQRIITEYPDVSLAPTAQYDIAGIYCLLGKYEEALKAYQRVIDNYPSEWEPVATLRACSMIRIGEIQKEMQQNIQNEKRK